MIAATVIVFLLSLAAFAYSEARTDARGIAHNLPIYHGISLMRRAVVCGAMLAIACIIWQLSYLSDAVENRWACLWLAPMGWAAWSIAFRFTLNRMRKLDWLYIAPWSNSYDHTAYTVAHYFTPEPWSWDDVRDRYFDGETKWTKRIHRAGLLAYAFELLIFAATAYLSVRVM